jgi:signal transduction histidine kinase
MNGEDSESFARRARFEAVRQRVFLEMRTVGSRWKFALIVPFHATVLTILATHDFPRRRLAIQMAAVAVQLLCYSWADRAPGYRARKFLMLGGMAILVCIANTGGLASPLILSLIPFFASVAMNPELENRRRHFVVKFLVFFAIMAWFSRACSVPSVLGFATPAYLGIAFASAAMSLLAMYHMGKAMTGAYERIALELAERREELCDENAGRTRALEGIAARLAHEVKNPLAAIKGLSTHVARNAEDPKVKERLTIVAAEAERLQEIVDGFLSFSRGLDDLKVAPIRPFDIASELALLLETRAAETGVPIEVRGSRELALDADGKKLRQALLNLVLNAMQASSRGSAVTLEIAKSCGDGSGVLRVIDHGAGMTSQVLDRIRKPYFTTKEDGSGLGIAIARGIIEQHGGTLRFESTPGRGTTAIVSLPSSCAEQRQALPNPCRMALEAKLREYNRKNAAAAEAEKPGEPARDPAPAFAAATVEKAPT